MQAKEEAERSEGVKKCKVERQGKLRNKEMAMEKKKNITGTPEDT